MQTFFFSDFVTVWSTA